MAFLVSNSFFFAFSCAQIYYALGKGISIRKKSWMSSERGVRFELSGAVHVKVGFIASKDVRLNYLLTLIIVSELISLIAGFTFNQC